MAPKSELCDKLNRANQHEGAGQSIVGDEHGAVVVDTGQVDLAYADSTLMQQSAVLQTACAYHATVGSVIRGGHAELVTGNGSSVHGNVVVLNGLGLGARR